MILVSNVILQLGFSLEMGKTFVPIGDLSGLTLTESMLTAVIPAKEQGHVYFFPTHDMNTIISRKYSKIPLKSLETYQAVYQNIQNINRDQNLTEPKANLPQCFINNNQIFADQRNYSNVFILNNIPSSSFSLNLYSKLKDSLIIFDPKDRNILKSLEIGRRNILLDKKSFQKYLVFLMYMNEIRTKLGQVKGITGMALKYQKQYIDVKKLPQLELHNYLSANFFCNSSLVIRLLIDSIGRAKELSNLFVPITYEAVYCMFEIPLFNRIIRYNSILLNTEILKELYRKYFFIKFGITTDIFGLSWTTDIKGILNTLKEKAKKKHMLIMLLSSIFRALSFTIRKKFVTFFFTFDFYTFSFSISAVFFPIKYSAYIDNHGKRSGVEIKSADGPQLTYF